MLAVGDAVVWPLPRRGLDPPGAIGDTRARTAAQASGGGLEEPLDEDAVKAKTSICERVQRRRGQSKLLVATESCRARLPGHLRFELGDVIALERMLPGRSRGWAVGRVVGACSEAGCFRIHATRPVLREEKLAIDKIHGGNI